MTAREFVLVARARRWRRRAGASASRMSDPFYSAETTATAWHVLRSISCRRCSARTFDARRGCSPARGSACAATRWRRPRSRWPPGISKRGCGACRCASCSARAAAADRGRRLDRHPRARRARSSSAWRRSSPTGYRRIKIKIKPGWDRGAGRSHSRDVRRHPADGRCQCRLHGRRCGRVLAALDRFRLDDDRAAARLRRSRAARAAAAAARARRSASTSRSPARRPRSTRSTSGRAGSSTSSPAVGGFGPSLAVHDLARRRGIPLWHGGMLETRHRPRAQPAPVDAAGLHAARRRRGEPALLRAGPDRPADRGGAGRHDRRARRAPASASIRCRIGSGRDAPCRKVLRVMTRSRTLRSLAQRDGH